LNLGLVLDCLFGFLKPLVWCGRSADHL
jgi:hypothetical protein